MKINKIEFINWFFFIVYYKIYCVFRVFVYYVLILFIIFIVEIFEGKGYFGFIVDCGIVDGYFVVCEVGEQIVRVYLVECFVVVFDFNSLLVVQILNFVINGDVRIVLFFSFY